jgi:hypothetical protein
MSEWVDKFLLSFALDISKKFLLVCQTCLQFRILLESNIDDYPDTGPGVPYLVVVSLGGYIFTKNFERFVDDWVWNLR